MKKPRKKRLKRPKHPVEVRAYRFAVRRNQDVSALHRALDQAHALRNLAAAERCENSDRIRAARRDGLEAEPRITKRDQEQMLAGLRRADTDRVGAGALHSLVVKNIVDRLDEGWKRFWDALRAGRPGVRPPRPIKRARYRSLTYPQYGNGVRLRDGAVTLSGIGTFRLHDHRKVRGQIRTVTMKWAQGRWWCIVTAGVQARDIYRPATEGAPDLGADPGLTTALALSDGTEFSPRKAMKPLEERLARESRKLAKQRDELAKSRRAATLRAKVEGVEPQRLAPSRRMQARIVKIGRIYTKVCNMRDHDRKLFARRLERRINRLAYEDHGLKFMFASKGTAKSAAERGLGNMRHALESVLGPRFVAVPNTRPGIGGNSQTCLCGAEVRKSLRVRWHDCKECGLNAPRDIVSANIVETIGFGTHKLATAAGSVSSDVGESDLREPRKRLRVGPGPSELLLKRQTYLPEGPDNTVGGCGLQREAKPVAITSYEVFAREPKRPEKIQRKHPASAG